MAGGGASGGLIWALHPLAEEEEEVDAGGYVLRLQLQGEQMKEGGKTAASGRADEGSRGQQALYEKDMSEQDSHATERGLRHSVVLVAASCSRALSSMGRGHWWSSGVHVMSRLKIKVREGLSTWHSSVRWIRRQHRVILCHVMS